MIVHNNIKDTISALSRTYGKGKQTFCNFSGFTLSPNDSETKN